MLKLVEEQELHWEQEAWSLTLSSDPQGLPWLQQAQGRSQPEKPLINPGVAHAVVAENCRDCNLWHLPASPYWEHVNDSSLNVHNPVRLGGFSTGRVNQMFLWDYNCIARG